MLGLRKPGDREKHYVGEVVGSEVGRAYALCGALLKVWDLKPEGVERLKLCKQCEMYAWAADAASRPAAG